MTPEQKEIFRAETAAKIFAALIATDKDISTEVSDEEAIERCAVGAVICVDHLIAALEANHLISALETKSD